MHRRNVGTDVKQTESVRIMDLGLKGKKALVCASSRGLGRGCAEALAEAGCAVTLNGRNTAVLTELAETLADKHGVEVNFVAADVSTPEGQQALLEACPSPDILVNNNGGPPRKDYSELDRPAILDGVVQNMVTPIELAKAVLPGMTDRGFGRIVNITSMSVRMPIEGLDLSSGARAGLTAFMAGVCRQVAPHGVTINNILPGKFDTDRLKAGFDRTASLSGQSLDTVRSNAAKEIPAGRFGTPEEFGQTCAFLCSAHAGYITGQNILLDGGLYPAAF